MSGLGDIEKYSRENRDRISRVVRDLGLDGTPNRGADLGFLKDVKPKRGRGRPKKGQEMTLEEKLRRRGYFG